MFVRIRWFIAGALAAFGGIGFLATKVKKAREKLTPANLAAVGKRQAASWLDSLADRVAPDQAGHRSR